MMPGQSGVLEPLVNGPAAEEPQNEVGVGMHRGRDEIAGER